MSSPKSTKSAPAALEAVPASPSMDKLSSSDSPPWPLSPTIDGNGMKAFTESARVRKLREQARARALLGKERTSAAAERLSSALSSNVERVARRTAEASKRISKVIDKDKTSLQVVQLHDQLAFTVSVVNLVTMAYFIGVLPQYYYIYHCFAGFLLIGSRWWSFKQQKQHYYLYDFCYWANLLTLVYCLVLPQNTTLFRIIFMMANGPLGFAIATFTNSLIFHSAAHMTSVFIHASPAVLVFTIRWYPSKFKVCENWPSCDDTTVASLFYDPFVLFYLVWAVGYFLWVYVLMGRRIKDRGYETLFAYVIDQKPMRFVKNLSSNDWVQKLAYSGIHAVFALATMVAALFTWNWFHVNLAFLWWLLLVAAWNASGFYFHVFAKRYVEEAQKRALTREESTALLGVALEASVVRGGPGSSQTSSASTPPPEDKKES